MSYADELAAAEKAGSLNRLSTKQLKLDPSDKIVGRYLGRELVTSVKKGLPDYFRYSFDLDDGPVNVLMSQAFDNHDGARLETGRVYSIEYIGMMKISGGRQFKEYAVFELPPKTTEIEENE